MKRIILTIVLLASFALSGCSVTTSGRQGGQNMETIRVETCGSATTVNANSCNAKVIKLGGGN